VTGASRRESGPSVDNASVTPSEWTIPERVAQYLERADGFPHRAQGESVLFEHIPEDARRVLDLGTGDGRLLALLRSDRPEIVGVGLDFSGVMLDAAHKRFAGDKRVELVRHDLSEPLPTLGRFDAVISSFAIHHLEHERKRSLYGEVFDLLEPGGVFANFEHVASTTHRLHVAFFAAIDEPIENEDPSDRLLDVQTQLDWLRELGFDDVDCYWKWLEMALLVGVKPSDVTGADGKLVHVHVTEDRPAAPLVPSYVLRSPGGSGTVAISMLLIGLQPTGGQLVVKTHRTG
jgi:SAM-dependent methyltransferase